MANLEKDFLEAADKMYQAFDELAQCVKGTDDYIDARMKYADAVEEYNRVVDGRNSAAYTNNVRKG